jgi:hypothetical protein
VFVAWMLTPAVNEQVLRTEIGYAGATGLLVLALATLYRHSAPSEEVSPPPRPA